MYPLHASGFAGGRGVAPRGFAMLYGAGGGGEAGGRPFAEGEMRQVVVVEEVVAEDAK